MVLLSFIRVGVLRPLFCAVKTNKSFFKSAPRTSLEGPQSTVTALSCTNYRTEELDSLISLAKYMWAAANKSKCFSKVPLSSLHSKFFIDCFIFMFPGFLLLALGRQIWTFTTSAARTPVMRPLHLMRPHFLPPRRYSGSYISG